MDNDAPTHPARQWLYRQLEQAARPGEGLSPVNRIVVGLIIVAAIVAILDTERVIRAAAGTWFLTIELVLVTIFIVEYLARVYAAGEDPRYRGGMGRLRYMLTPWALVDLFAILPVILTLGGYNTLLLRLLRMIRLLRLARLGRFSDAWDAVAEALRSRRYELYLSGGVAAFLLLLSSSLLYVVEASAQPDDFGSIPRALWWSVATLTTVGYGDVTPVTPLGQILAGITAVAGIGLIAMPTGILAAAFSDAIQRRKPGD